MGIFNQINGLPVCQWHFKLLFCLTILKAFNIPFLIALHKELFFLKFVFAHSIISDSIIPDSTLRKYQIPNSFKRGSKKTSSSEEGMHASNMLELCCCKSCFTNWAIMIKMPLAMLYSSSLGSLYFNLFKYSWHNERGDPMYHIPVTCQDLYSLITDLFTFWSLMWKY